MVSAPGTCTHMSPPLSISVLPRVHGWSPPGNQEYVRVALPPVQNAIFHISDPQPTVKTISNDTEKSGVLSSTSSPQMSDIRKEGSSKQSDPTWIARPRNEFILFRCEYVKRHSNGGRRVRKPPGAEAEKTLSKQAAEAWRNLSPQERLYWKERADGERTEHARKYPDYRYRPKKSNTSRRRQGRSSPSKNDSSPDDKASGSMRDKEQPSPTSTIRGHQAPRKSTSVPEFSNIDPALRRLRSSASQSWLMMGGSPLATGSSPLVPMANLSNHGSPAPQLSYNTSAHPASLYPSPQPLSVMTSNSSLLNWDGNMGPGPVAAPQPVQPVSQATLSLEMGESSEDIGDSSTSSTPGTFVNFQTNLQFWTPEFQANQQQQHIAALQSQRMLESSSTSAPYAFFDPRGYMQGEDSAAMVPPAHPMYQPDTFAPPDAYSG